MNVLQARGAFTSNRGLGSEGGVVPNRSKNLGRRMTGSASKLSTAERSDGRFSGARSFYL